MTVTGPSGRTADAAGAAAAALTLACLFWAGNFVTGRAIRGLLAPETLNFLRWLLAAAVFLPFTARGLWRHRRALAGQAGWILGLALTGVVGFQQATYTALTSTAVANAALLLAATPVLILASSALTGRARLGLRQVAAVAVSFLGVSVILGRGDPLAVLRLHLGAGDAWLLVAVSCWTAYTQMLRAAPRTVPADVSLMATMLAALPVLGALAAWRGEAGAAALAALPPAAWAAVGYVGLCAALAAFLLWGYGVRRKGPEAAGLYINLMPVFSAALAWLFLGEAVTAGQAAGAALILVSLWLGRDRPADALRNMP
ncbi:DMT family transporter [Mangrovicoccus algicola]|uniref:DMT family transporter n=1 Tax=Mangrovicoccus algicola TaxID=2771008 RepID=A0A8J6YZ42_9RHOB|nr:DMT family transporter [Mangrovicoccus algicola]MBE3640270.1 DMT family transporter [Mangrovicoccus algicola]